MATIDTSEIKPGTVVAGPVVDRSGRVLVPSDCPLTAKHLRVLKMWGVTEVEVVDREQAPLADPERNGRVVPTSPELLAKAETEARQLLQRTDLAHPAMAELFRWCIERKAAQKAQGVTHA